MVFIISDAYNAAKYSQKSHEFFLSNARIERIDFCTDIPLFQAGINNTIVHFAKAAPDSGHLPLRVRRRGESHDDFERNAEVLITAPQDDFGATMFKMNGSSSMQKITGAAVLGQTCYISWGLRPCSDDRYYPGAFGARDMISEKEDGLHPKPYIENRDTIKWWIYRVRYLEWNTERAPAMFARPTFPELYEVPEKLMAAQVCGDTPRVVYDNYQLTHNHSMCCFAPWHHLKGVVNNSINKTAKYRWQSSDGDREEREKLSQQFHLKYLLAIMNSSFAKTWLAGQRRNKMQLYPNDWKQLPIASATMEEQTTIAALVDKIHTLYSQQGYPLPREARARLQELAQEIDNRVARLY